MWYKGILIYPNELDDYWLDRLEGTGINFLGIHPMGGLTQGKAVEDAIAWIQKPETQRLIKRAEDMGMVVEYEMHALSWLLPRGMFEEKPEWFRMDENGNRVSDHHCCPSNPEAVAYISQRAEELTRIFYTKSGRYHFWTDDVARSMCHCPKCRALSASDQAMLLYNAINAGVRRAHPGAGQCYLAYFDMNEGPKTVKPDEGIYLEYAPMERNLTRPMNDPESEKNVKVTAPLPYLLETFGTKKAQVLEYWLDNSWFSGWKWPIQRFAYSPDLVALDSAWYEKLGFETMTSFAIFLGKDYYDRFGEHFDIATYSKALGPVIDR